MKKFLNLSISLMLLCTNLCVYAEDTALQNATQKEEVVAPIWNDYVPKKYENPRNFSRGKSIAELSSGIFLTTLIITAPIGIPMVVHSTTKLKNKGYYDRKIKFENGLLEAEKITNPAEKEMYYQKLINECRLDTNIKYKKDLKKAKKAAKEAKKKSQNNIDDKNVKTVQPQEETQQPAIISPDNIVH